MKPAFTLSTKILLLAIGNVLLLSLLFVFFLRLQLREDFGQFLLNAGRDRTRAVAQRMIVDLEAHQQSEWTSVLAGYSAANGVTFSIYGSSGNQMAGPEMKLPPEVQARLNPRRNPDNGNLWIPPFVQIADADVAYWLGVWFPVAEPPSVLEQPWKKVLVVSSPTAITNPYFFNPSPWVVMLIAALTITLLYWLPLIRSLTGSISQMTNATAQIAEGHFETQLQVQRGDEIGRLSTSIQQMAARLDAFTRAHKRFLGDVAHELRSPIARIQVAAAILGREREAEPLNDLKEDADILASLTDELLTFARAELLSSSGALQPVRIADIAQRAIKLEGRDHVAIYVDVDPAIQVYAEPEYLFRSLANLIRNAVRYAGESGEIRLTARVEGPAVVISVADSGPGIPNESLEKIFTPFYRLEESRDRQSGGTGLGLAIVKSCVEACQGSVRCQNRVPTGLEVMITLKTA